MLRSIRNLFYVLKRYRLATVANLLGLCLSFMISMVICIHVKAEYRFDAAIPNIERIYQLENLRDDHIWESNFSRPQLEKFFADNSFIEASGITNNLAYHSIRYGVSGQEGPDAVVIKEKLERVRPGFVDVFGFEMVSGDRDCLEKPGMALISEETAQKIYGPEDPVGKVLHVTELRGLDQYKTPWGLEMKTQYIVGGVYRDFPENTRINNPIYTAIPENEMMHDWDTGPYYGYLLISGAPEAAHEAVRHYVADNKQHLVRYRINDLRIRPVKGLYFSESARHDGSPYGNKLRTDTLLLISLLIIGIALVNYTNLSMALVPVRIKSVMTQKILGCPQSTLRRSLILESLGMSGIAFLMAFLILTVLTGRPWLAQLFGNPLDLFSNWRIMVGTLGLSVLVGIAAGVYPACYITSFPPVMAINGSYSLSTRAKLAQQILIGMQFVISIALVIGVFFVFLQNRYIGNTDLGFDRENVLEMPLSIGMASRNSETFRERLMENAAIRDVVLTGQPLVWDGTKSFIGFNYRGYSGYMHWLGVSANFPEVMGLQLIAGRSFRPGDESPENKQAVCMLNESAAREIMSWFPAGQINDISELIGTNIQENIWEVTIIGIYQDVHFESFYREITPQGYWVSAHHEYRRTEAGKLAYIKIAPGNPTAAIDHIQNVNDEFNPGFPVELRFVDESLNELYRKSYRQGILVAVFCGIAVLLSLVGVFGIVIFESQGREKEIAVRKVFGATIREILWRFNLSFLKTIAVGFVIAVPLAWYGISNWLEGFAYRTPLYLWVYLAALVIIGLLTVMTVTLQSYRVARANPAGKLSRR